MSILDRKVLAQDLPQHEELTRKAREKKAKDDEANYNAEVERVNKENIEIEKQNAEAEAKYQKELEEYNKQKALRDAAELENTKFDREIGRLMDERTKALSAAHAAVWGPNPTQNRSWLRTQENNIIQNYDQAINRVAEQKRVVEGYKEFAALYPSQPLPRSIRTSFLSSPGSSISVIAKTYYEGRANRAEYDRQTSIQQARTAPSYTPEQSAQIQAGSAGLLGSPTPEMKARADKIKPTAMPERTVFPFTPSVAQDKNQVRGLINVKTVENIYGGQQIPTNPRAYVKGLERNIPQPGTPIREQPIGLTQTGKIRVSNLNEWNGQQTGKVPVSDPKIDRMIGFYGYAKTNEIIGNYNRIITNNNLLIKQENRKNKIEFYKYRRQQVRDDPYFKSPKAQGPPKPKYETVLGVPGSLQYVFSSEQTEIRPNPIIKSFEDYVKEINPKSELNLNKYKDRSGLAEPISTLDIALIATPGGRILGAGKLLGRGVTPLIEKQANKFLINKIPKMLDSGIVKPKQGFSYEIPYKPTKRPNEINLSGGGEIIGKFSNIKSKPIAARQSDIRSPIKPKPNTVKIDPFYKPRGRFEGGFKDLQTDAGEIIGKNTPLSKSPIPKQTDIRSPIKPKPNTVKIDPFYKPTKRPNEIDLTRDDILTEFSTTKIGLGKGRTNKKDVLKGKQDKPVEEDYFYKPTKRPNEIDYTDVAGDPKIIRKEQLKSEVQLGLKRELKRIKRLKPEFKTEKINLGGEGQYIAGRSGRQQLLQIQKSEQVTKKKLVTKRQSPVNINWVEKIDVGETPRTGSAPVTLILPEKEQKKKKTYLQEQQYTQTFEVPLSAQRPQIKTIPSFKIENELATPQRTAESIKYSTIQPQKISSPQKLKTPQRYIETTRFRTPERITSIQQPKLTQKQTQKLSTPTPLKIPTRQASASKIKQPLPLKFRYKDPKPPKPTPRLIAGFFKIDEKKKPEPRKTQPGQKADFLGNVPESQIGGIFNRVETTYGQRRINKLLAGDKRVVSGGRRAAPRRSKPFVEGKANDMFGFKYEAKKKRSFKLSL